MTTWAEAHLRAATLASEIHADLDTPLDRPVDVFSAIERMGLVLAFAPLGRVSGLYLVGSGSAGVLLHEGHPLTRQRYTAGHELGHHMFGHAAEIDMDLEEQLQRGDLARWPDHEKEAEAFGAWFLMPRRLVRAGLSDLSISRPNSPLDVYLLSLWLGTSYAATARHLATTRLISQEDAGQFAQIPPRQLKQELLGDYTPPSFRSDVWLLGRDRRVQPVDVRPGDRLVVTLDEVPSSGYSWRMLDLPQGVRIVADSFEDGWDPGPNAPTGDVDADLLAKDFATGTYPHSFLLEVDPESTMSSGRIAAIKDRPWTESPASDSFEVSLNVWPRRSGIQLDEADLAMSR